ncbi:RimJ/RimL family protein N-acetyltransferase [Kitasatospora gansuensis]|uniref:RimJ/RimL family protein N-acetyltransferase n=1 Tax=Kitasatospora gansuensis TaxID=258050 RepID=A0A7W7SEM7_9ACTN|nr:GNAT family protein [Kitasatospora gansuensis]MBB4948637.1 RimJ/RimL family protein N-acetyltransferase [Kitasatospora gansuensis]
MSADGSLNFLPTFTPVDLPGDGFALRPWSRVGEPERRARELSALADDPAISLWNPLLVTTVLHAERWLNGRTAAWERGEVASFALLDPDFDQLLGTVTTRWADRGDGLAMIGYWLVPAARGRGLATRAVETVTRWAFTTADVRRIELAHAVGNTASCHVATRTGYLLEGTLRQSHCFGDGNYHDEHLHARLATDA